MNAFLRRCAVLLLLALPIGARAADFVPQLDDLASTPLHLLPPAVIAKALEATKHEPLRFAVGTALSLDERSGAWDEPEPGVARWRLRLASAGASSMSARLDALRLPKGGTLHLYGANGEDLQGPYDAGRNGTLWLPIVRAEQVVLEARMPAAKRDRFRVTLGEGFHGYRDWTKAGTKAAIGSDSGSCNIDVVCSQGNAWRDEIRSVVLLTMAIPGGGMGLCSGTLVNNTARDDRPLILTANHCGIREGSIASVIAYFNVESTSCGGNQNGTISQNIHAARFLARGQASDFTLFELASEPPAGYGVHYAGWDTRDTVIPSSGAGIHHPQGDEKKITLFSAPLSKAVYDDGQLVVENTWEVGWAQGTTEGGSSGSGLWNQDARLVGVLTGGAASCLNQSGHDFYGRLGTAWVASTSACDGQLKAHMDPGNTGCRTLNGKDPGNASPPSCGGTTNNCSRPDADGAPLRNGVAKSGLAAAVDEALKFYIDVPAGATNLQISTSGGSGDADLYVKRGATPSFSTGGFDCRSWVENTNTENCTFASPGLTSTTRYHVVVHAFGAFADAQLVASFAGADIAAAPFDFANKTGVATGSWITSSLVTISGISGAAPITVAGHATTKYSKNGGAYTSADGTVANGDTVRLRLESADSANTARTGSVTIGGVTDAWKVTTGATDKTPNFFDFKNKGNQAASSPITSNVVTVAGINTGVPITITGGGAQYSKNGGAYTSASGTVSAGDTVQLKLTSASTGGTKSTATVKIGTRSDSWSVTTAP